METPITQTILCGRYGDTPSSLFIQYSLIENYESSIFIKVNYLPTITKIQSLEGFELSL